MYRTFARTPEEVFNRHPHGATIRGLVGVMMCLNFLSFLSLRSPHLSRYLPSANHVSLSLSLARSLHPYLYHFYSIHLSRRFYSSPRLRSTLFLLPSSRSTRPFSTLNARTRARIHAHAAGPPLVVCRCLVVTDETPYPNACTRGHMHTPISTVEYTHGCCALRGLWPRTTPRAIIALRRQRRRTIVGRISRSALYRSLRGIRV